ncbi:hypothetical protein AYO22_11735 [Fonsecaea multimorphosa]|nr:hypothetical protein AYO22_11735 [Fonsecaea multimorphosa]
MDLSRMVSDLVPKNRRCLKCIISDLPCDNGIWHCEHCQLVNRRPGNLSMQAKSEIMFESHIPSLMYKCLGQHPGFEWPFEIHFDMTWLDCIICEEKDEDKDNVTSNPGKLPLFKDGAMSYFPNDVEIKNSLRWFTSRNLRLGGMQDLLLSRLSPLLHEQALRDLAARHQVPCTTLEDWWKTYLMSGLILSTWEEAVIVGDFQPTQLDQPAMEVIKLFHRKTQQLADNLDAVTPDLRTLNSMRAIHPVMEEARM